MIRWWLYASNYLDECRDEWIVWGDATSQLQRVEKGKGMERGICPDLYRTKFESRISSKKHKK
jgi:hypothetical protein